MNIPSFIESLTKATYTENIYFAHKPVVFILNLTSKKIDEVKSYLIKKGLPFNDGYEKFHFSKDIFQKNPFFIPKKSSQIAKLVSCNLKLISAENYKSDLLDLDVIFKYVSNVNGEKELPKIPLKATHIINISDIENLNDTIKIIQE